MQVRARNNNTYLELARQLINSNADYCTIINKNPLESVSVREENIARIMSSSPPAPALARKTSQPQTQRALITFPQQRNESDVRITTEHKLE